MQKILSNLVISGATLAISTAPIYAQSFFHRPLIATTHAVPEIDASAGLLAIAAVLAVMAFVWERRRRAV